MQAGVQVGKAYRKTKNTGRQGNRQIGFRHTEKQKRRVSKEHRKHGFREDRKQAYRKKQKRRASKENKHTQETKSRVESHVLGGHRLARKKKHGGHIGFRVAPCFFFFVFYCFSPFLFILAPRRRHSRNVGYRNVKPTRRVR